MERQTITLPDGYNGHMSDFYTDPLTVEKAAHPNHASFVKLAKVDSAYLYTWRELSTYRHACTTQGKQPQA